jgi:hypothetical protein
MSGIIPFVRDKSFSPETIEIMATALAKAKDFVADSTDETLEVLAMRIITFASAGESDPDKLAAAAIAPYLAPRQTNQDSDDAPPGQ